MRDEESSGRADAPAGERVEQQAGWSWSELLTREDWWAIWLGAAILAASVVAVHRMIPPDFEAKLPVDAPRVAKNPLSPYVAKLSVWKTSPAEAFSRVEKNKSVTSLWPGVGGVFAVSLVLFGIGLACMGKPVARFVSAFAVLFALTVVALVLANQERINYYNLEYPLWALLVGLLIANTIGTPEFLKAAVHTEFYIKTGLVLLGATILLDRLLALGLPGICTAWIVTPIVLISTYAFGQKVLKIPSRSLNMTISADMAVCGVSAAIATAAACRAKKEELSLAIGISLAFTVVMMIVMPPFIRLVGMSEILGGAWIGGTIDATGAVAAAGAYLGERGEEVAITVKMIQNILIGVIAFGVAVYWVTFVEPQADGRKPTLWEIWYRFPKFVLGFVAASVVFTWLSASLPQGESIVGGATKNVTEVLRGWFFAFAFVSIGLESNFREMAATLKGGKPLVLYVVGQSLNLLLSFAMAWLMFEVLFKDRLEQMFP
jgi:uncharacterized membrane protein YadS